MHELAACIDLVGRRGVVVQLAVRGQCPLLPQPVRRGLTEPALVALTTAVSAARVTLVAIPDRVALSVVTDGAVPRADAHAGGTGHEQVDVAWTRQEDRVWMEATWVGT